MEENTEPEKDYGQIVRELAIVLKCDSDYLGEQAVSCALHGDEKPSASINFGKGVYHCFSCGEGMTVRQLHARVFDYPLQTEEVTSEPIIETKTRPEQPEATEETGQVSVQVGISEPQTLPDVSKALREFIERRKIRLDVYRDFGAYPETDETEPLYGRIVFPYADGKYQARDFLGRKDVEVYSNNVGGKGLYNLGAVDLSRDVILVEGVFDLMALYQMGFTNVVSSLGATKDKNSLLSKTITDSQINKIAYTLRKSTVFILFDRDFAGYTAALDMAASLEKFDAHPIILEQPEEFGKDANEGLQIDATAYKVWLSQEMGKYDQSGEHYITRLLKDAPPMKIIPTGYKRLDEMLGGGLKEGIHAFPGAPKVGKTAFMLNLARRFAQAGHSGLFVSYENSVRQCWARIMSQLSTAGTWVMFEEMPKLFPEKQVPELLAIAKRLKIVTGWKLPEIIRGGKNVDYVIIDYLQNMPGDDRDEYRKINTNLKGLIELSRDYDKIILVVSSMKRDDYDDDYAMDVFKDSGNVEYGIQSGVRMFGDPSVGLLNLRVLYNRRGKAKGVDTFAADLTRELFEEVIE